MPIGRYNAANDSPIESQPMNKPPTGKPAKRFFAKALPSNNGYTAQYAAPGLVPGFVNEGRHKQVFDTEFEAQFAAQAALINVLQARIEKREIRAEYQLPTANELSEALDNADMSPQYFSWLTGAQPKRVLGWLDGSYDIPHHVYLVAKLMGNEDTLELMEDITDARTETKPPK